MILGQAEGRFARSQSTFIGNSVFTNNVLDKNRLSKSGNGHCMTEISYHELCFVKEYQIGVSRNIMAKDISIILRICN